MDEVGGGHRCSTNRLWHRRVTGSRSQVTHSDTQGNPMQKGLGISALVIAILAMFTPLLGTWLTVLVALLAAFAYGSGLGLGIASIVVNVFHIIFFSPLLWTTQGIMTLGASASNEEIVFLPWMLLLVQAVALAVVLLLHRRSTVAQPAVATSGSN